MTENPTPPVPAGAMMLELVMLPVSDIDRSIGFYRDQAGFTLDVDVRPADGVRVVQLPPPGSYCSITMTAGIGQALALGLIDYVAMDVVPAVFGRGRRYFGSFTGAPLVLDDPDVVIPGERVLHLRYPVRRGPAALSTDQEAS